MTPSNTNPQEPGKLEAINPAELQEIIRTIERQGGVHTLTYRELDAVRHALPVLLAAWNRRLSPTLAAPAGWKRGTKERDQRHEDIVLELQSLARTPRAYSTVELRSRIGHGVGWMNTLLMDLKGWESSPPPPIPEGIEASSVGLRAEARAPSPSLESNCKPEKS